MEVAVAVGARAEPEVVAGEAAEAVEAESAAMLEAVEAAVVMAARGTSPRPPPPARPPTATPASIILVLISRDSALMARSQCPTEPRMEA